MPGGANARAGKRGGTVARKNSREAQGLAAVTNV